MANMKVLMTVLFAILALVGIIPTTLARPNGSPPRLNPTVSRPLRLPGPPVIPTPPLTMTHGWQRDVAAPTASAAPSAASASSLSLATTNNTNTNTYNQTINPRGLTPRYDNPEDSQYGRFPYSWNPITDWNTFRCPYVEQHAKKKFGVPEDAPLRCNNGWLNGLLAPDVRFHNCCEDLDTCYYDCTVNKAPECHLEAKKCMDVYCDAMIETTQNDRNHKKRCRLDRDKILVALADKYLGQPVFLGITAEICYCVNNGE